VLAVGMKVLKGLRAALGKGAHSFMRAKNDKVKVMEQYNTNLKTNLKVGNPRITPKQQNPPT